MKWLGLVIISLCCCMFGGWYALKERRKLAIVCEVERLIRYMSHQIEYYRQGIDDIFLSFESDLLDNCGFSGGLGQSWERAMDYVECPEIIKNELISFGLGLGMKSGDEQVESCKRCLKVLEEYTSGEKKLLSSRVKIYFCLGITVGVVILIMGI